MNKCVVEATRCREDSETQSSIGVAVVSTAVDASESLSSSACHDSLVSMARMPQASSLDAREAAGLAVATVASAAGLVVAVGPVGLLVAVAALVTARLAGSPFAVGVTHLGALLGGDTLALAPLGVLEVGAVAFVLTDSRRTRDARFALVVLVLAVTAVGLTLVSVGANGILWSALALVVSLAVASYGLHRYERVKLGLVASGDAESGVGR
jgi:hypothetical protein